MRKDGSLFWANVVITAMRDDGRQAVGFAKVTRDLTERKRAADELLRSEVARGRAEVTARRALLLDELMRVLAGTTRVEETLQQLANLLVRRIGDYAIVDYRTGDSDGPLTRVASAHKNPELAEAVRQLRVRLPPDQPEHPVARTFASGQPTLVHEVTPAMLREWPDDTNALLRKLAPASYLIVPLTESKAKVVGTISIVSSQPDHLYEQPDLLLASELAQRASLAIENARLWEIEAAARRRAEELGLRLEAVLQQMPAGAAIAEAPSGRLILANRFYVDVLGREAERSGPRAGTIFDVRGKPVAPADTPLARAVRGESVDGVELRLIRPDGSTAWLSCNAGPIRDPRTHEVIAGVVAFSDVTSRKTAERGLESLAQASATLTRSLDYETTLRNLAASVVPSLADWCTIEMLDAEGELQPIVVTHFDPGKVAWAQSIAGRWRTPKDSATGSPAVVRTLEPALFPIITDELLQLAALDPEHLAMLRFVGMSSALSVAIALHGKGLGVLSLISAESQRRFTTDDVEIASEVARRAAIAVENARLYGEAQSAASAALEAVKVRDEFISVASHELRTPLTALRMSTETVARLVSRSQDTLKERIGGKLELGLRQLDRLEALIEQLLDVSQLSEGRLGLTLERVDLVTLAREVTERFADQLARDNTPLTLEAEGSVVGTWDRSRLDQVLTNLLGNALKYGRGKPISVTVAVAAGKSGGRDRALLTVRDGGIGIAPEDQARIFERYERAAPTHHFGGLGLGLWIARRMVEALGGELMVSSSVGAGATFTVTLPLEPA